MDDLVALMKRGKIYDGCPIVTKGTIRIRGGDISIDTSHDMMLIGGKNFAGLCDSGIKNEQGDLKETHVDEMPEMWKAKINELTSKNEELAQEMKKTTKTLQTELQQEYSLRASIEENLTREKRISEEATQIIVELKTKLEESIAQNDNLKSQLDSSGIMLEEKEEKIRELKLLLADKDAKCRVHEIREKEALLQAEGLREQVILQEEERLEDKKNSAVLLEDFNEWRNNSEEEINELKGELEHAFTTITTLKNELEIAELEDSGYQHTISTLIKENEDLKHEVEVHHVPPPAPAPQENPGSRRLKAQTSLKNLFKNISKPKEKEGLKEKDIPKEKEVPKEKKDKRYSVASMPNV